MDENKLKTAFPDMVVLKDPSRASLFKNLSLPSYMRDWLVMKFSDQTGKTNIEGVQNYIEKYIPGKNEWEKIKQQLNFNQDVTILVKIEISVDIKDGNTLFEIPAFGGSRKGACGIVDEEVIRLHKDDLLKGSDCWGIIRLRRALDTSKKKVEGYIKMTDWAPFCPYTVDLDFFGEARKQFTLEEWLDVLISAVDYNPDGYTFDAKMAMLCRLLPFVEKRINIMELAPKGTGKSYVFENISKYGWLIASGTVTRASLLYDNAKKKGGLLTRFDYVAFDEMQTMKFQEPDQIQTALKSYMENGVLKGNDTSVPADAGIVILANIDAEDFDEEKNMVSGLNKMFGESATLDRFNGILQGWRIPRLNENSIAKGWALNSEYFSEILHGLRSSTKFETIVDEILEVPKGADHRDVSRIKSLCTAFVKLLYPNAKTKDDIPEEEFIKYCLNPSLGMRRTIRKQLTIIDPQEFSNSEVPDIKYKDSANE